MKTRTYKGRLVALIHKTRTFTRIMDVFAYDNGTLGVLPNTQVLAPNNEVVNHHTPPPTPVGKPGSPLRKRELTGDDHNRLSAARGLIFDKPGKLDRSGRKPTVTHYNLAILTSEYCGAPIVPVTA